MLITTSKKQDLQLFLGKACIVITSRQEVAIEHVFYSCKDKGKMIIITPCLLLELYIEFLNIYMRQQAAVKDLQNFADMQILNNLGHMRCTKLISYTQLLTFFYYTVTILFHIFFYCIITRLNKVAKLSMVYLLCSSFIVYNNLNL